MKLNKKPFFVAPHEGIGKCDILQKYSRKKSAEWRTFAPYFCGEADIEAGCKQVLKMYLRDVFNFFCLATEFDICSIKLKKQTNI